MSTLKELAAPLRAEVARHMEHPMGDHADPTRWGKQAGCWRSLFEAVKQHLAAIDAMPDDEIAAMWRDHFDGKHTQHHPLCHDCQADSAETAARELWAALNDVVTTLRKEAPGTPLNSHRFDALGIRANGALARHAAYGRK